jgi:predicted dehydrogenase
MQNTIKVGLMAYGMSGKIFHAPFFAYHDGFDLVAIVERSKNDAVKDYPQTITYRNVEDLLTNENIELVVINTPNYTHYEFAKAALNAGKHVLIEKPFSVTKAEAEELFSLGFRKGLKVMAYQNRRFDSDFMAVEKVIKSQKLGKIIEAHIRFDRYRNEISPKRFKEETVQGAGIFYDLGAHMIDQAIALFGVPMEFIKTYGKYRENTEVDDFAQAHLKYSNGLNVFVTCNMLVVKAQPAYTFYGTNGTLIKYRTDEQENQLNAGVAVSHPIYGKEKPNQEGYLYTINNQNELVEELILSETGDYKLLFDEVYKAIREDGNYFVSQQDVTAQLAILEKR